VRNLHAVETKRKSGRNRPTIVDILHTGTRSPTSLVRSLRLCEEVQAAGEGSFVDAEILRARAAELRLRLPYPEIGVVLPR